jgi:hypothetical protein
LISLLTRFIPSINVSHDVNQPYNQAIISGQNQVLPNYTAVEWLPRFGFNILNHPHFDQPDADIASPTFGSVINPVRSPTSIFGSFLGADASPRLIQLHASITF